MKTKKQLLKKIPDAFQLRNISKYLAIALLGGMLFSCTAEPIEPEVKTQVKPVENTQHIKTDKITNFKNVRLKDWMKSVPDHTYY